MRRESLVTRYITPLVCLVTSVANHSDLCVLLRHRLARKSNHDRLNRLFYGSLSSFLPLIVSGDFSLELVVGGVFLHFTVITSVVIAIGIGRQPVAALIFIDCLDRLMYEILKRNPPVWGLLGFRYRREGGSFSPV